MARPLRVEFAGALYPATARGNGRRSIFLGHEDSDRVVFLDVLGALIIISATSAGALRSQAILA